MYREEQEHRTFLQLNIKKIIYCKYNINWIQPVSGKFRHVLGDTAGTKTILTNWIVNDYDNDYTQKHDQWSNTTEPLIWFYELWQPYLLVLRILYIFFKTHLVPKPFWQPLVFNAQWRPNSRPRWPSPWPCRPAWAPSWRGWPPCCRSWLSHWHCWLTGSSEHTDHNNPYTQARRGHTRTQRGGGGQH